MSLSTLGLSKEILDALKDRGYTSATPIQKALIPAILQGHDIIAGAKTGTGKSAAFILPILQELHYNKERKDGFLGAIIVVPTRELAKQLHQSVELYGKYLPLKSVLLYGGSNFSSQERRLKMGADIIVATSGRLLEHIKKRNIALESVRYLVLDEADTILDMGFINEVIAIIEALPKRRQNILVSATLTPSLKNLATKILHKPKRIEVDAMGSSALNVKQVVYPVVLEKKTELLSFLIGSRNYQQVLVFVRKKEEADEVAKELNLSGLKTSVIHGNRTLGARSRALEAFKEGKSRVLVATDIAARGLDIPSLEVVINYDIPHVTGDFIHRIGRTGRAGKSGLAITLLSPKEEIALKDVERLMGRAIKQEEIEGYAPKREQEQKGARKKRERNSRVGGAFGKKRSEPKKKKRKTTKRDAFKELDMARKREKSPRKKRR